MIPSIRWTSVSCKAAKWRPNFCSGLTDVWLTFFALFAVLPSSMGKQNYKIGILQHPDHAQTQAMFKSALAFINNVGGSVELSAVYINVSATENSPAEFGVYHEANDICGKLCGISADVIDTNGLVALLSVAPHRLVFNIAKELGLPVFTAAAVPASLAPRLYRPTSPSLLIATTTQKTVAVSTSSVASLLPWVQTSASLKGTIKTLPLSSTQRMAVTTTAAPPPQQFSVRYLGPDLIVPMFSFIIRQQWLTFVYVADGKEALDRFRVLNERLDRWSTVASRFKIYLICLDQISHSPLLFHSSRYLPTDDSIIVDKFILDMSTPKKYDMLLMELKDLGMAAWPYQFFVVHNVVTELDLEGFEKGGAVLYGFQLVSPTTPLYRSVMRHQYPVEPEKPQEEYGQAAQITAAEALVFDQIFYMKTLLEVLTNNESIRITLDKPTTHRLPLCGENFSPAHCQPSFLTSLKGSNKGVEELLSNFKADGLTGWISFDKFGRRVGQLLNLMELTLDQPLRVIATLKDNGDFVDTPSYRQQGATKMAAIILNVTTIDSPPFLTIRNRTGGGRLTTTPPTSGSKRYVINDDEFEGFCVDLADEIGRLLNIRFVFRHVSDGQYGAPDHHTRQWNGMIGELIRGEAHAAIAPLTITSTRERVVQMTKPILNTGISIMIKKPEKQQPGVFSFLEPLSSAIWVCTLFAYCGTAVCMWILCRLNNGEMVTPFRNSFWSALCALLGLGGEFSPKSFSGRLLATVWYFFCLILISSYTANMTAFLTVERLEVPIESADDLVRQDRIQYGTLDSGSTKAFFQTSVNPLYRRMWEVMNETQPSVFVKNVKEGVERVRTSSGRYAFLLESVMNAYYNQKSPCNTMQVGPLLDSKGYGIVTPLGSPYHADLNYAVLYLKEIGVVQQLVTKWWYDKGECPQDTKKQDVNGELTLNNVTGVFFILIGGLVLGIFFSVIEFAVAASGLSRRTKVDFAVAARELISGCILGSANKTIRPLHSLDLLARVLPWVEMPNFSATMLLSGLDSISPRDPRRRYIAAACLKEFRHRQLVKSFSNTSATAATQPTHLVAVTPASSSQINNQLTSSQPNLFHQRAIVQNVPLSQPADDLPQSGLPRSITLPPLWNEGINLQSYSNGNSSNNNNSNRYQPYTVERSREQAPSETSSSVSNSSSSGANKKPQTDTCKPVVRYRRTSRVLVTSSATSSATEEDRFILQRGLVSQRSPSFNGLLTMPMPETLQLRPQIGVPPALTGDESQVSLYDLLTTQKSVVAKEMISSICVQDINLKEEEKLEQHRWYNYRGNDLSNV